MTTVRYSGRRTEPVPVTYGAAANPAPDGRRLVVLDIDDTLYLERDYVRSGFTAVGAWAPDELGVDGLGERAWAAFEAGVRRTIFDEALAGVGVEATPNLVSRLVEVYQSHAPTIEMLADARAWLDRLAPHVALAVVTDGPLTSQHAKAEALQLSRWADLIVFTETLGPAAESRTRPPSSSSSARWDYGATGAPTSPTTRPRTSSPPIGWGGGRCACAAWAACVPTSGAAAISTRRSRAWTTSTRPLPGTTPLQATTSCEPFLPRDRAERVDPRRKRGRLGAVTTPTGNGDDAGDRRLTVAHLITVDSSLRYLVYPPLTAVRDLGAIAWASASRDCTPTGWWPRGPATSRFRR